MTEKVNPEPYTLTAFDFGLKTFIKPDNGTILPKVTGIGNDASLLRIRTRKHIQPSVADLRMVVRVQRRNKHPHSTKKHK